MKQSPIHFPVLTLRVELDIEESPGRMEIPFGKVSDDLERLLYTFICDLCAFLELCLVGVPVEAENVERVLCGDGD
jgi:hypothetical protein